MDDTDSYIQRNLPSPYFTINPGCLDDKDRFSYRDLQKLAKQCGISARGKRVEIVERLRDWHRERSVGRGENEENNDCTSPDMRYVISNFSNMKVDVGVTGPHELDHATPPKEVVTVNPRFVSPLVKRAKKKPDGTPIGILSPHPSKRSNKKPKGRRIQFSFLNSVKVIPHRDLQRQYRIYESSPEWMKNIHEDADLSVPDEEDEYLDEEISFDTSEDGTPVVERDEDEFDDDEFETSVRLPTPMAKQLDFDEADDDDDDAEENDFDDEDSSGDESVDLPTPTRQT